MSQPVFTGASGISNSPVLIIPGGCVLRSLWVRNTANATVWLQLFNANAATDVTYTNPCAPAMSFAIVTVSQQGIPLGDTGVYFPKGLVAAVSATAYNNVAAPSAAAFVTFVVD